MTGKAPEAIPKAHKAHKAPKARNDMNRYAKSTAADKGRRLQPVSPQATGNDPLCADTER